MASHHGVLRIPPGLPLLAQRLSPDSPVRSAVLDLLSASDLAAQQKCLQKLTKLSAAEPATDARAIAFEIVFRLCTDVADDDATSPAVLNLDSTPIKTLSKAIVPLSRVRECVWCSRVLQRHLPPARPSASLAFDSVGGGMVAQGACCLRFGCQFSPARAHSIGLSGRLLWAWW